MRGLIRRFLTAWRIAGHVENPAYAVIYDVPVLDSYGKPTGDFSEEYYETFSSPREAHYLFRTAYPDLGRDDEGATPRLVMILGDIDHYAGKG